MRAPRALDALWGSAQRLTGVLTAAQVHGVVGASTPVAARQTIPGSQNTGPRTPNRQAPFVR